MKYPYIGRLKDKEDGVVLFCDKDEGAQLNSSGRGWHDEDVYKYTDDWDENKFKNITAEYLANTYGEVKSKEHAEFIVKLCENAGFKIHANTDEPKSFMVYEDFFGIYSVKDSQLANEGEREKITIPLPPECESVDEWPRVGDDAIYDGGSWKVCALYKHVAFLTHGDEVFISANINKLKKPKTPEQELRDDLMEFIDGKNQLWIKNGRGHIDATTVFEFISDALINEYNITKKGEGDE